MKRIIALLLSKTMSLMAFMLLVSPAFSQVYTATNYYYNNFDGGAIGSGITKFSGGDALNITSATATNNLAASTDNCLQSSGVNSPGMYSFSFIGNNAAMNNEDYGWEWTFIYKNSANNANYSEVISAGQNSWKYWFMSSGSFSNPSTGYFLTQDGSSLALRWRYSNTDQNQNRYNQLLSFDMSSLGSGWQNKTYAIRVQRIKRQGSYVWHLYVDEYTTTIKEARTRRSGVGTYHGDINTYTNSGIHINSTTAGRFKFDESF